ncbi:MAG: hypothetical protein JXB32_05470 [Deltaproteobacteria bacterium]|nr:hypothetical protein [Deltaproteobacteria bacterium]
MNAAQVRSLLADRGLAIEETWDEGKGEWLGWLVVETKGWRATLYFAEPKPGTPMDAAMLDQVNIDGAFARGRGEVDRIEGELRSRLGPQPSASEHWTWQWDGPDTRLVVSLFGSENDIWKLDEEWTPAEGQDARPDPLRRERDPEDLSSDRPCANLLVGPLGRRELAWEMSHAQVVAALHGSPVVVGPEVGDSLVGPRDNIDPHPQSGARFEDGARSGSFRFRSGGLASVKLSTLGPLPEGAEAVLRGYRERFGEPCRWSEGRALEWRDGATEYGLDIVHEMPSDEWAVDESRHPEPHVVRGGSQGGS